jgi:hypothetical protein
MIDAETGMTSGPAHSARGVTGLLDDSSRYRGSLARDHRRGNHMPFKSLMSTTEGRHRPGCVMDQDKVKTAAGIVQHARLNSSALTSPTGPLNEA